MARSLGLICLVLTASVSLGGAGAQEPTKDKLDVDAVFKKLDANSDGKVQKDEFLKLADRFKDKEKARAKLSQAFVKIDPQNLGLSKTQLRTYLDGVAKQQKPAPKRP